MAKINEPNAPEKLNRIVSGTDIEGVIVSDSNIRIDGRVKGSIDVKGKLVVGSTGRIDGEIICDNAEIEGSIVGKITVNGILSLKSTARLDCDIITQKLAIEPGAVFSGNCEMGPEISKEAKTPLRTGIPPVNTESQNKQSIPLTTHAAKESVR